MGKRLQAHAGDIAVVIATAAAATVAAIAAVATVATTIIASTPITSQRQLM